MKRPLKDYSKSSSHDDVDKDKKTVKLGDQFRQQLMPSERIKANGLEKSLFKAFEHQKFPSLHEALGPALTVGQFFGNLPVEGILDRDFRNIRFKWSSLRTIYAITYLLVGAFEVSSMIFKGFSKGFNIVYAEVILFYFDAVAQSCTFLYLATQWKDIISFWSMMEKPFLSEPYKISGTSLSIKIRWIGIVFIVFYLTEHLMFIGMELHDNANQLTTCNVSSMTFLNNYMRRERPHLLDILPYRWWIFPIFQWTITLMAFCWNYVDFFIIILSLALSTRFNQLNERLRETPPNQMDRKFWLDIRLHYTNLVDLLEFIDDKISLLVLFSMSHNLFLICTKLFEAIKYSNRPFLINDIYFYFYLFFLIFRTLSVLAMCSSVHTSSNYPLLAIREAPTTQWGIDLKRLSDMIQTETISLSGGKFFYITRQMILAMAGTIVTYELVLLDRGSRDDDGPLCNYFENMNLS